MGGGPHGPPLGVISCHSVGDAPTNSIFLDFSNKHPYFHMVKSFFIFFCNFHQKITVKFFFRPKKERFFHENGQKHIFLTNISIFCFKYVISILWEIFWGALHVCRSKIGDVEISFHIRHIVESQRPRGCSWRDYATQEADQELWPDPPPWYLSCGTLKIPRLRRLKNVTNFQYRQFLTYRDVMHLKNYLKAYWLHNWNKKCQYLWENNVFDHFL